MRQNNFLIIIIWVIIAVNSILIKENGKQNYLVFHSLRKYFELNSVVDAADYVLSWQWKGLSNESIKPPTTTNNSLTPELNYYGTKTKIKFTGSCLKQSSIFLLIKK